MKSKIVLFRCAAALCSVVLSIGPAFAQWAIGDRVEVNGELGTVTKFGPPIFGGGNQIYVHLDRFGDAFPNTGIMVDWKNKPGVKNLGQGAGAPPVPGANSSLGGGTGAGGGAGSGAVGGGGGNPSSGGRGTGSSGGIGAGGGVSVAPNVQSGGSAGNTGTTGAGGDIVVPKGAPPSAETFKNVLRARIPQPGWGDTITLDFQSFILSGPMQHVVRYEGHLNQETILGGPGRGVQAWKANTKFIQRTHYKDIHADDQWFTKSGDYWFYKDKAGYWVSEDENVQLGPTNYVHKG